MLPLNVPGRLVVRILAGDLYDTAKLTPVLLASNWRYVSKWKSAALLGEDCRNVSG